MRKLCFPVVALLEDVKFIKSTQRLWWDADGIPSITPIEEGNRPRYSCSFRLLQICVFPKHFGHLKTKDRITGLMG
jgi:hypothetical protein